MTLIEVMVAVAVLAFALTALVKMTGQNVNTLSYLEQKTFAQWVASNKVNELEVMGKWPPVGINQGQEMMGGTPWFWQVKTSKTSSENLRRLDLTVMKNKQNESPVYTLTAFINKP